MIIITLLPRFGYIYTKVADLVCDNLKAIQNQT